jgi:uncharacterized membrane protein
LNALKVFGLILILIGLWLVSLSFLTQPPGGWGLTTVTAPPQPQPSSGGGFAGCVVIFFIPICFSSNSAPGWFIALGVGVFLAFFLIFILLIIRMFRAAGQAPRTYPYP